MRELWIVMGVMVIVFLAGFGLGYVTNSPHNVIEGNKKEIHMKDTSIFIQRQTDTIIKEKLVKVPDTKVIHDVQIKIVPDSIVHTDTLIRGDTVYITKTIGMDTILVTMAILRDNDNGMRVQAKVQGGKIVGSIDIPREQLIVTNPLVNTLGAEGAYTVKDGTSTVGVFYDRTLGCFLVGGRLGTTVNDWSNIYLGLRAGVKF